MSTSASAVTVMKYVGAADLIDVGLKSFKTTGHAFQTSDTGVHDPVSPWSAFRQGVLTDVLNPKVAIFSWRFSRRLSAPATATAVNPLKCDGWVHW